MINVQLKFHLHRYHDIDPKSYQKIHNFYGNYLYYKVLFFLIFFD